MPSDEFRLIYPWLSEKLRLGPLLIDKRKKILLANILQGDQVGVVRTNLNIEYFAIIVAQKDHRADMMCRNGTI